MKPIEHSVIIRDGLLDKYLNQQLSDDIELKIEEHLLYCSQCRNEINELQKLENKLTKMTISSTHSSDVRKTIPSTARLLISGNIFKIAASIAIIITIGGLSYKYYSVKDINSSRVSETVLDTLNQNDAIAKMVNANTDSIKVGSRIIESSLLADNFKPFPLYESMVRNLVRSVEISMSSPSDSIRIMVNEKIHFDWTSETELSLTLLIFNNKAELVMEMLVSSPVGINSPSVPGLYYWKLDTKDETLAAGKVLLMPQ